MREIKFRGKRVDNGKWVYGYFYFGLEHTDNGAPEHYYREYDIQLPYITDGQRSMLVDTETIGQYTGLKDKNGKNVYEGDILLRELKDNEGVFNKTMQYVFYEHGQFKSKWFKKWRRCFNKWFSYNSVLDTNTYVKEFKVIGNIYENPELLEELHD